MTAREKCVKPILSLKKHVPAKRRPKRKAKGTRVQGGGEKVGVSEQTRRVVDELGAHSPVTYLREEKGGLGTGRGDEQIKKEVSCLL